ncbi:MAG: arginine--tRNA ligase [Prevotellaceae bacterium]|jgi:arginyl-tRNA synthetase|nr:arginine--tRNA ligase [Prevotellaceae bacterium]
MNTESVIKSHITDTVRELYPDIPDGAVQIQKTRKEFDGDYTLIVFPLLKWTRKSPEQTAKDFGDRLLERMDDLIESINVVKGFLNIKLKNSYWLQQLSEYLEDKNFGFFEPTNMRFVIEYSSPNTNKPLHLGHIRNILLGWSVANILKACGHEVIKVNLVNDRGIHICKSMVAWLNFGNGETPELAGKKGDHLAGDYYVKFDKEYKSQIKELVSGGMEQAEAENAAPIFEEAREMLRKWEARDPATIALWEKMNGWVYDGFDETYRKLGVSFDKTYYESDTWLQGKKIVEKGLSKGIFFRNDDGSVWIDLTDDGLDRKLLLRSDGTSVYMTQDLGTAEQRFNEYRFDKMIYVVGNEQNYHFQALKLILRKLGYSMSDNIYHLSYGMVELPEGKMKSREGSVVDADDLIEEMIRTAGEVSRELGKLNEMTCEEAGRIVDMIGLGALKYFILKVDPKKTMLFNPKESIDFNGNTASFIQYTHARIKSVLRKNEEAQFMRRMNGAVLDSKESELIKLMESFPETVRLAGENFSPALIANYTYDLAREYNQFYHDSPILKEENTANRNMRLALSYQVAEILKKGMYLLGISVPEKM